MKKILPKIDIVFSPAWWQGNFKAELAQGVSRERLLFDRFGDVGLGQANPPEPIPIVGDEYGDRFMAAFWGCEIVYQDDQAPSALPCFPPG